MAAPPLTSSIWPSLGQKLGRRSVKKQFLAPSPGLLVLRPEDGWHCAREPSRALVMIQNNKATLSSGLFTISFLHSQPLPPREDFNQSSGPLPLYTSYTHIRIHVYTCVYMHTLTCTIGSGHKCFVPLLIFLHKLWTHSAPLWKLSFAPQVEDSLI